MLAAALEAEVEAYLAELVDGRDEDGHRLVTRNGHARQRKVQTVAGAVEIEAPRVNDKRVDEKTGRKASFRSSIVPPWCRRSPRSCRCCTCTDFQQATSPRCSSRVVGSCDNPARLGLAGRAPRLHGAQLGGSGLRVPLGRRGALQRTPRRGATFEAVGAAPMLARARGLTETEVVPTPAPTASALSLRATLALLN